MRYTDDIMLTTASLEDLRQLIARLITVGRKCALLVNAQNMRSIDCCCGDRDFVVIGV